MEGAPCPHPLPQKNEAFAASCEKPSPQPNMCRARSQPHRSLGIHARKDVNANQSNKETPTKTTKKKRRMPGQRAGPTLRIAPMRAPASIRRSSEKVGISMLFVLFSLKEKSVSHRIRKPYFRVRNDCGPPRFRRKTKPMNRPLVAPFLSFRLFFQCRAATTPSNPPASGDFRKERT